MKKMKLVLVGNGMAGVRTLEDLLNIAPDLYDITVFGAEPHPNYNRILLSPVLAGEQTVQQIVLNPLSWYEEHGITLHCGKRVERIDRIKRRIIASDGTEAEYDRLLLATGSMPFILPVPGKELDGVVAYRDIADTEAMIDAASRYRHAVVVGGGLLGLEAANGLMQRGMQVTVVHIMPWLMERQLDEVAGGLLQKSLEARGIRFEIGAQTEALMSDDAGRVRAVRFKDGREIPADLVVMAAGIRPNTALAEAAGLHCGRGIVVNDTLQTVTDPRIYAVGECAAHRGIAYGLVAPLFEQGKVCATHLAHFGIGRYTGSQTSTKLKVTGIDLFSAGDFMGGAGCRGDRAQRPLRRRVQEAGHPRRQADRRLPVRRHRRRQLVLQAAAPGSQARRHPRQADVRRKQPRRRRSRRSQPRRRHGRQRRGLRLQRRQQGRDLQGHQGQGPVHPGRGAQAHQGQRQLRLVHRAGRAAADVHRRRRLQRPHRRPRRCAAAPTSATRRCARRSASSACSTIDEVYRTLDWRTPNGCASVPPGGQLLPDQQLAEGGARRPAEPLHQRTQPRQHPEGRHLQRDSAHVGRHDHAPTNCGASPTRWTSTRSRRSRSPAASASTCSACKKEDLPAVWKDIGMPSGHAYAKALRTVKTCVGSEWCRFGTQDRTKMGKDLERALWRMYAPHKVEAGGVAAARATAPRAASRTSA